MRSATDHDAVSAIAVDDIADAYGRRGIAEWSDHRLVAAVAGVVARPREAVADSFVLHAPLELAARAALLPSVAAPMRPLARMHVLAIAAQYEAFGEPADLDPDPAVPDDDDVVGRFADAMRAGDLTDVDRSAVAIGRRLDRRELTTAIGDLVVPMTAAAAHASIFLFHLLRADPRGPVGTDLLRPLARELARRPDWRISWLDDRSPPAAPTEPDAIDEALTAAPQLGVPGSTFIHPLMMQVDGDDVARGHLTAVLGRYDADAARAILRVAARAMLVDTPEHAPYGWSHCLTIPQAVVGIAPRLDDADAAIGIAATQVLAFRAALGSAAIGAEPPDGLPDVDPAALATAAATRHDAHIVKYVLACLDAAAWDPPARSLYLAAAQHLLDWWDSIGGDPTDPLR